MSEPGPSTTEGTAVQGAGVYGCQSEEIQASAGKQREQL
jgi:hypothetical protein